MSRRIAACAAFACAIACHASPAAAAPWAQDWKETGRLGIDAGARDAVFAASDNGYVIVGDAGARLALFDPSGVQRWSKAAAGSPLLGWGGPPRSGSAVVDPDGSAWFTTGQLGGVSPDGDATLTRIGPDGVVAWSRLVPGSKTVRVADGLVVAGCGRAQRTAIASKFNADGDLVWQRALPGGCGAFSLAGAGDVIYAVQSEVTSSGVAGYTLSKISAGGRETHAIRQHLPWEQWLHVYVTAANVYVTTDLAQAHAFDAATLAPRWESADCLLRDVVPATASIGAGDAICTKTGTIFQLDALNGNTRWSTATVSGLQAVRALPDGVLVADAGSLRTFDAADGTERRSTPLPNAAAGSAAIGIGPAANGGVGVARAVCTAPMTGCTASLTTVALADGALTRTAYVEGAASRITGDAQRSGDDIAVNATVTGGETDALRVRLSAVADGHTRWEVAHPLAPGRSAKGSRAVIGSGYVAVALAWSGPASADGQVPVGTDVAVYERATGALRWTTTVDNIDGACCMQMPQLIVDAQNDLVLGNTFQASGPNGLALVTVLRRFASADGAVRWRAETGSTPMLYAAGTDVIVAEDDFATGESSLTRMAVADGSVVWRTAIPSETGLQLAVLPGGDIVVNARPRGTFEPFVTRLDFATGQSRWARGYGDGISHYAGSNVLPLANGELMVMGITMKTDSITRLVTYKPYVARMGLDTGNVVAMQSVAVGEGMSAVYLTLDQSADGRLWVTDSRRSGNEISPAGVWLTEIDMNGAPLGSQTLRLTPFSDIQRRVSLSAGGAPEANRVWAHGFSVGAGAGEGYATAVLDTSVAASGNLAVSLDPLPSLHVGKTVPYGATVRYNGTIATTATLHLQLPWSGAGSRPVCTAPGGDCVLDERSGWLTARVRLNPGDVARVAGTLTAGEIDGAYSGRNRAGPLFLAAVSGETSLRETTLTDNFTSAQPAMGLFADGFD